MRYAILSVFLTSFVNVIFFTVGIVGTFMASISMMMGGVFLSLILMAIGRSKEIIPALCDKRIYAIAFLAASVTAGISTAVILSGIAPVLFLTMLSPTFAALLVATGIVKDTLSKYDWMAVALSILAAAAIASSKSSEGEYPHFWIGCIIAVLAALGIATNYFLIRSYNNHGQHPYITPALFLLLGGMMLLPWQHVELNFKDFALLSLNGLIFVSANICLVESVRRVKAHHAILAAPIGAASGALLGFIFLGQSIGLMAAVGFTMGIASILVSQKGRDDLATINLDQI